MNRKRSKPEPLLLAFPQGLLMGVVYLTCYRLVVLYASAVQTWDDYLYTNVVSIVGVSLNSLYTACNVLFVVWVALEIPWVWDRKHLSGILRIIPHITFIAVVGLFQYNIEQTMQFLSEDYFDGQMRECFGRDYPFVGARDATAQFEKATRARDSGDIQGAIEEFIKLVPRDEQISASTHFHWRHASRFARAALEVGKCYMAGSQREQAAVFLNKAQRWAAESRDSYWVVRESDRLLAQLARANGR